MQALRFNCLTKDNEKKDKKELKGKRLTTMKHSGHPDKGNLQSLKSVLVPLVSLSSCIWSIVFRLESLAIKH